MTAVELAIVDKAMEFVNSLYYGTCKGSCINELEEMFCDHFLIQNQACDGVDVTCILQKYI